MANRISAELTSVDLELIKAAIEEIRKRLPFLLEIDPVERKRGQKMGQASLGFVQECLNVTKTNPDVLPRNFDLDAFQGDLTLYQTLADVDRELENLFQKVRDTLLVNGKDLMEQSNIVYNRVKEEARRNNSLRPLKENLGEFYKKTRQGTNNGGANGTT